MHIHKPQISFPLPDPYLIFAALALVMMGFVFVFSTSTVVAESHFNDPYYFTVKHLIYAAMGVAAFVGCYITGPERLRRFSALALMICVILLALVYVPGVGLEVGGAMRWVRLGPWSFQPSELLKLVVPLYVAHALCNKGKVSPSLLKGILPILLFIAPSILLVLLQPDLGTVVVLVAVVFAMVWVTGVSWRVFFALAFGGGSLMVWQVLTHPYQFRRILAFLNPWADPQGISFHLIQSWMAIGSGGFWGQGLGNSKLKYFYLPQQYTDFIFAVICEEGGFVAALLLLLLLMVLAARCFRVAILHHDPFQRLLATGLSVSIIGQSLLNIGVVVGLLPTTGIPLPLVSFGGTSLLVTCVALGWLARMSSQV